MEPPKRPVSVGEGKISDSLSREGAVARGGGEVAIMQMPEYFE